ncbi:hypothetical protein HDU91_003410, partial [Kappamyces sp. JEL0680]
IVLNGGTLLQFGAFHHFTIYTWITITTKALGGILVAFVVKYSNIILKVIATPLSVILSAVLSSVVFNSVITYEFVFGGSMVAFGTAIYIVDDSQVLKKRASRKSMALSIGLAASILLVQLYIENK